MDYIARITWVKHTDAGTERDEDCAIFETRDEAEAHVANCHADDTVKPGWAIDESWIDEEEE